MDLEVVKLGRNAIESRILYTYVLESKCIETRCGQRGELR